MASNERICWIEVHRHVPCVVKSSGIWEEPSQVHCVGWPVRGAQPVLTTERLHKNEHQKHSSSSVKRNWVSFKEKLRLQFFRWNTGLHQAVCTWLQLADGLYINSWALCGSANTSDHASPGDSAWLWSHRDRIKAPPPDPINLDSPKILEFFLTVEVR